MGCGCNAQPMAIKKLRKDDEDDTENFEMEKSSKMSDREKLMTLFKLFWVISGLAAFVMSLVCTTTHSTPMQKTGGILLAIFFGPFYWIYFFMSDSYCKQKQHDSFY